MTRIPMADAYSIRRLEMPLYMETVMDLLRSSEGDFDYDNFKAKLEEQELQGTQRAMLNIRLQFLNFVCGAVTQGTMRPFISAEAG